MPSVYEILLECFLSSIWLSKLSWLERQDAFRSPTLHLALARDFKKLMGALSPQEGWIHLHRSSPPWPGAWDLVSEMSFFEKPAKRQMLLLSLHVWNFCTAAGFKGASMREKSSRLDPKLSRNFRTRGSQCWTEDPLQGPWSQLRDEWGSACSQASLDDIAVTQMALNSYARLQGNSESQMPRVCWKSTGKVSPNTHILLSMHGYQS